MAGRSRPLLLLCAVLAACSCAGSSGEESGPAGRIVDLADEGVVLRPPDGGKPELIRLRPAPWGDVDYSPNGEKIAYDSEIGIVVARADGTNARPIPGQPASRDFLNIEPSWSPDGERIVFSQRETLYTIATGGGDLRVLGRGSSPDWSAKDDSIVLVREWDPNRAIGTVGVIDTDGTGFRGLARGNFPSVSPDGAMVAYSTIDAQIYVVSVNGDKPRLVVRDAFGPVWSPDGRYLAFARYTTCGHAVCSGRIFVRALEGGRARPIGPLVGDVGPPLGWIED